ncbi:hypothetical protein PV10_04221 [Exophiala mesophila]|uniref:asparaginase n=1 Tax=Exophiala mesophila TaxID=212818 RepID=A0A0D1XXM1_EXOME|nr:uncharacterized protein PV10_04221 [Exophiala mesophila]KIV92971.1 hypothetical protein PV10_04221 [Exophiala mesophila]
MFSAALLLTSLALSAVASPFPDLHPLVVRQELDNPFNASLPNVTILATGGTIAARGTTNTQTIGYSVGLGVQEIIDAVPEILNISNIQGYQVTNLGSSSMNNTVLLQLAEAVNEELAKDEISGVVVTHGTSTLEETAFFLELVTNTTKPIVVVGAMRPSTALSADGPLNLLQAVTLACSPKAVGRGVMITLNDRIGSAWYATKMSANSLDTFYSTEAGQLGFFINQVPYFYYEPSLPIGKVYFDVSGVESLPKISVLYSHQDMDSLLFNSVAQNGAAGLVVAGTGGGSASAAAYAAAQAVFNETGIPMVWSHRSPDGFAPPNSAAYRIGSGFLNPQKARILMQLAVHAGYDNQAIRDLFALGYPA